MGKRDFSSRDGEPLCVCSLFLPGCVYLISLNPVHSGGGGILSSQAHCRAFTDLPQSLPMESQKFAEIRKTQRVFCVMAVGIVPCGCGCDYLNICMC